MPGVSLRSEPDRKLQRRFLAELRQHLVADEVLLSLLSGGSADGHRLALEVVRDQHRHLRDLIADFDLYSRLEADLVPVDAGPVSLMPWLEQQFAVITARAERLGASADVAVRSFVPDRVTFDVDLAARALAGVFDVAVQRAVAGPVQVQVAYQANAERLTGELTVDIATRGGGFADIELGYVFQPLVVQDGASRALLGLSIGHRLCGLLGGELSVDSPGRSVCSYRMTLAAPTERGAVWLDPVDGGRSHGPVRPPRALFVGRGGDALDACRTALRDAGFVVEQAGRVEQVLARLAQKPGRWTTMLVDARDEGVTIDGFVDAVREHGFRGGMVVVGARLADAGPLDCCLAEADPARVVQAACRARDA